MASWWIDAQRDRETFRAAVLAQMPRWRENEVEINKVLARLQTVDMVIGAAPTRKGWSTGTAQVRG
jgi:endonuclease III-like uncharacterized protein